MGLSIVAAFLPNLQSHGEIEICDKEISRFALQSIVKVSTYAYFLVTYVFLHLFKGIILLPCPGVTNISFQFSKVKFI